MGDVGVEEELGQHRQIRKTRQVEEAEEDGLIQSLSHHKAPHLGR
jgi:hypothetical protein